MALNELDIENLHLLIAYSDRMAATILDLTSRVDDPEAASLALEYQEFRKDKDDVSGESETSVVQSMPMSEPPVTEDPEMPSDSEVIDGM